MRYRRMLLNWCDLNPFCHTIGLPHSTQFFDSSLMLVCIRFSLSNPTESIDLCECVRNNWYAEIILWIFVCVTMWFLAMIPSNRKSHFLSLSLCSVHMLFICNGQMLFRPIYLILCFGVFGSLLFQAVNFRLKT